MALTSPRSSKKTRFTVSADWTDVGDQLRQLTRAVRQMASEIFVSLTTSDFRMTDADSTAGTFTADLDSTSYDFGALIDEDAMTSNSATRTPSQQSVKAYVDAQVGSLAATYQPLDADLTAIAALTPTDSNFIVGNGSAWVAESGATARTSIGLGTADNPQFATMGLGAAASASTALLLPLGTTGVSSLRIPHGAAPTAPVNGDVWTTTSSMFARINGSTVDLGGAGSGATTALDNLASVAINTTLVSDTDITDDLGTAAIRFKDAYLQTAGTGDTAADTFSIRARDTDGASWETFLQVTAGTTPSATLDNTTIGGTTPASGSFNVADVTKTAGNAVLTIENTGNTNASGIIFTNEDSNGTGQEKAWLRTISNTGDTSSVFQIVSGSNMGTGIEGTPAGSPAFYYFTPQAMGIQASPAGNGPLYIGLTTSDFEIVDASDSAGTITIKLGGTTHTLYTGQGAGGGGLGNLIGTASASGTPALFDITSGSFADAFNGTYDRIIFEFDQVILDADDSVWVRFSQSSSFLSGASDYQYSRNSRVGATGNAGSDDSASAINIVGGVNADGDAADSFIEGHFTVIRPAGTNNKKALESWMGYVGSGGAAWGINNTNGRMKANTSAIDGVRVFAGGGANLSGSIRVWGVPTS